MKKLLCLLLACLLLVPAASGAKGESPSDVRVLLRRLNLADREKPVFLAGDLNARPESPEIAELKKGFTILSDTSKPTFRADNPSRCIDYILVDTAHAETVKVQSYETIADTNATDHCGLVLKAEFNGGIK